MGPSSYTEDEKRAKGKEGKPARGEERKDKHNAHRGKGKQQSESLGKCAVTLGTAGACMGKSFSRSSSFFFPNPLFLLKALPYQLNVNQKRCCIWLKAADIKECVRVSKTSTTPTGMLRKEHKGRTRGGEGEEGGKRKIRKEERRKRESEQGV